LLHAQCAETERREPDIFAIGRQRCVSAWLEKLGMKMERGEVVMDDEEKDVQGMVKYINLQSFSFLNSAIIIERGRY